MSTATFKAAALKVAAANKDKAGAAGNNKDKGDDDNKVEVSKPRAVNAEPKRIKYKADIERGVVITIFERNGWTRTEGDDWQIGWFTVNNIRAMFHPDSGIRFGDQQMVNHYPNHYELTRKDNMVKNIKRYMRDTKSAAEDVQSTGTGAYTYKDGYIPMTYNLPADYTIFAEEQKRTPNATWIMKPCNAAQGKGIFLVNKLAQLKKWAPNAKKSSSNSDGTSNGPPSYIISRYVDNPLLVGGKKFDLRLYVLVTCFRPLRVYLYLHGFARFCSVKYVHNTAELDNMFVHLTNVAIQKQGEDYNSGNGGKWHVRDLRLWLEATRGFEATEKLFSEMNRLIVHSLLACQDAVINDRHCFECYGYDLLIDDDLKPWLVEVNASPSLAPSTPADRMMKLNLIRDVYRVVVPPDPAGWAEWRGAAHRGPMQDCGAFVVLYDEAAADARISKQGGGGTGNDNPASVGAAVAGSKGNSNDNDDKDNEDNDNDYDLPKSLLGKY